MNTPLHPPMHPPDWGRFAVASNQAGAPVGDPTRWGASVVTPLDTAVEGSTVYTPQILLAAAKDQYSRGWSLLGQLSINASLWSTAGSYPTPAANSINVGLEIVQGEGQAQLTHQIMLMIGGSASQGLCNQQSAINGGPYGQIEGITLPDHPLSPLISRPFAAVGALVGNTISIRGFYNLASPGPEPLTAGILTLILAPIAAGTQL